MGSSYRLETPRSRRRPDPLHFEHSSFTPSSVISSHQQSPKSPPLLYELPSPTSMSPPTSPKSKGRLISPTSPSFPGRSRTPRSGRPTPPPVRRNRSVTPLGVVQSDLERFADQCRAWYFNQDDKAGHLMTQTLATIAPSQRASYARLQASTRAAYHRSVTARRHAEFDAHLSATQPGGSLLPYSRANPSSPAAQKERLDRFQRFLRTWCTLGMPGPQPFFYGLWALMRLQTIPENIGGAGCNRIDWEIDDAVFKETAGKDFMLEAIDVLKGVLAFEETPSSKRSSSVVNDELASHGIAHSRSQSQPLASQSPMHITKSATPKRPRAPSDPFLDTPALSRSVGSSLSQSSDANSTLLTTLISDKVDDPPSPLSTYEEEYASPTPRGRSAPDDLSEEFLRVWTSPDLPNSEYRDLLKLFPSFLTRRPLPRFPTPSKLRATDLEEGFVDTLDAKQIRFGTGCMWVGSRQRSDGWRGSWWSRFISWWKEAFC
ncbi:hypothetical protein EV421DRAFT_467395 [Armillaria borealis]|uniref:Uncharacterized protein n=1 Tax=Armillaria borealis TaxID=47425 RepID=A0AA39N2P2_9AGAR|nr:hypothetical protein EV421DRAFT_467395 [Armillaria borealis]